MNHREAAINLVNEYISPNFSEYNKISYIKKCSAMQQMEGMEMALMLMIQMDPHKALRLFATLLWYWWVHNGGDFTAEGYKVENDEAQKAQDDVEESMQAELKRLMNID